MTRLIDGDELRDKIIQRIIEEDTEFPEYDWGMGLSIAIDILDRMLPVDVEPVRHGKWIRDEFGTRCGACGLYAYRDKFDQPWESPYCPNCGAEMECEQEKE